MNEHNQIYTILPGARTGAIMAPASKSLAHRSLICAALSDGTVQVTLNGISKDIQATIDCLNALGAGILVKDNSVQVSPICRKDGEEAVLPCQESGSTLRFLLPLTGALKVKAAFCMEGRLPERPMEAYENVLESHGMRIVREGNLLKTQGCLKAGIYSLPGNISSQYFSGLLFALPLLDGDSQVAIEGELESADYVALTEAALENAGIRWERNGNGYHIFGGQSYHSPTSLQIEGDYSGAAFFLCGGALSKNGIIVRNLERNSRQGDRRIVDVLRRFGARIDASGDGIAVRSGDLHGISIDASMIPDLIPALSVVAACAEGTTTVHHAQRLRMKESDRIKSTLEMLRSLGVQAIETEDGMVIEGQSCFRGGTVDSFGDHRIAMSAAIAAFRCTEPIEIRNPACVEKSYTRFWSDYESLEVES